MILIGDFKERCSRAKNIMGEKDIDALCLSPSADMYYLTGFWTSSLERLLLCILSRSDEPLFIVPKLYEEHVKTTSWVKNVEVWAEDVKLTVQLKQFLQESGLLTGKIAVPDRLWARHFKLFQEAAPKAEFKFTSETLGRMRMIKSKDEIGLIEKSAELAEEALEAALPECKQGIKEFELAARLEYEMRVKGSEAAAFDTIVASGPNSSLPHYSSGGRKLCDGDFVTIDVGATYGRYCSDLTRTVVVGKVDSKRERIYNMVRKAQQEAISAVRPGATAETVDLAARRVIREGGYAEYFIHRTGHGVGLDIHEFPYIHEGDQTILEPGMTFSVEPGVYIPGAFGVRIEDVVVVTEDGCRPLTRYPSEMTIV